MEASHHNMACLGASKWWTGGSVSCLTPPTPRAICRVTCAASTQWPFAGSRRLAATAGGATSMCVQGPARPAVLEPGPA